MHVDLAELMAAKPLAVLDKAATPAAHRSGDAGVLPGLRSCRPLDPEAPPIRFEVNLPTEWKGARCNMAAAASTAC